MRYIACDNKDCANRGAPYTTIDDAPSPCPVCGVSMVEIPEPVAPTPDPEPFVQPEQTPEEVLADARGRTVDRIRYALNETDRWAARHVEDGVSLTPARIAYRQELRSLLDGVATSADPASIEIPDPPPPPKT